MQLFKLCGKRKKLPEDTKELCREGFDRSLRKQRSELLDVVELAAATALGCQRSEIAADTILAKLGLDSGAAVRFVDLLQKELDIGSRRLPASLVFDYPSVAELVDRGLPRFLSDTSDAVLPLAPQAAESKSILISSGAWQLPGAEELQVLWTRQQDEVQEIPLCRWDWTTCETCQSLGVRHGSFIENADQFDAEFFSLSAAETQVMDPQQRLMLTTSYRALAGSGHDKATLQGTPMAIFAALSNQDWYHSSMNATTSVYTGTGVSAAVAANRISFTLGLRGPSATIDTACSSSLTAISAAADILRRPSRHVGPTSRRKLRESVAAGCELLLGPNSILLRSTASMLSPIGRCQTFNATADGYVRGEGSGAMLLTLGNDPSWCGSEVMLCAATTNQDGRSATLTAPNGQAQEEVLLDALWLASVDASSVSCVECHGTGTALGDPIEARALRAVLGRGTQDLWLGAGKSHLGHLEAAAGFAGLAKVMCSLQNGAIAPNLHFNSLNPHIDLANSRLVVPTAVSQLRPEGGGSLMSGLSSFGFGGTNAHALLRVNPPFRQETSSTSRKVAMLFSGQEEIRPGVSRDLYAADATFRIEMDRCAELCKSYLEHGLLDLILSEDEDFKKLLSASALYSFVTTFCLQHAMAAMWKARGVQPVAVLGHSLGDFAAACVAGVMSLEEGLRLVAARGRLLDERCIDPPGRMAAIFAPLKEVETALVKRDRLNVAAINAPSQTVVAGPKDMVEEICQQFRGRSKLLKSPYAMHSKLLSPVLEGMKEELKTCKFAPPAVTFVSCMSASVVKQEVTEKEYWLSHDTSKAVDFLGAVKVLESLGCSHFLEVGPQPVLAKMARTFSQAGDRWLTSLELERHETETLLSVGRVLQGAAVSRRISDVCHPHSVPWVKPLLHPLLGSRAGQAIFSKTLRKPSSPQLASPALRLFRQHRVQGEAVLPATSHLLLMAAVQLEETMNGSRLDPDRFIQLKDVSFEQVFPCSDQIQIEVEVGEEIQIRSQKDVPVHARAKGARLVGGCGARGALLQQSLVEWKSRCTETSEGSKIYRTLKECQLEYGPSFRSLLSWSSGVDGYALACLRLETEAWEQSMQLLHPGILDGAFQLMILAHQRIFGESADRPCLLPFSVDECVLACDAPKGDCWATLKIRSSSAERIQGDVEISCDGLLMARLSGIHMRSTPSRSPPSDTKDVTYDLIWEPRAAGPDPPSVLLCGAAAHRLQRVLRAARCVEVAAVEDALRSGTASALLYVASGAAALDVLVEALALLQAVQRAAPGRAKVLLVTEGAQPVEMTSFDPNHAGIWGLARSARLEVDFPVQLIDVSAGECEELAGKLLDEEETCFRGSKALVPRLKHSEIQPAWPMKLDFRRGAISSLSLVPQRRPLTVDLLRVAAVGLNFRDVLNVMGLYPGDPGDPGLDCSGTIADVADAGEAPGSFALGEDVFGISFGCLRTYAAIKEPRLLTRTAPKWSHFDAAALPTVWSTVEVALNDLAKLKAGQRLLVHAGAGGVGLTAVQYALRLGATVYATAGREEKKQHLLQMGVRFVASSRDGSLFQEELAGHLTGEKMDVVLNSLSHDDFIGRSLKFLRPNGVFVEIGKRGIWSTEQMQQQRPDVQYQVLAMDTLCEQEPNRFQDLLVRLSRRMETDWVPLQREVFEGLSSCSDALQVLRRAEKIGKIVVSVPLMVGPGAYAVTGGTGALGLCVARRLVEEGAKELILISRSGAKDLGQLQKSAAQVRIWQCDLASCDQLVTLASTVQLRGLLHLAGRLQDALLGKMTRQDFEATFGAKVWGLQALREALGRCNQWESLDFLLSFSSTAAIFGAAGQGNYAAANACMDAWMSKYRLESSRAITVQWGAWLDIGMAAQQPSRFKHLAQKGISAELGMAVLTSVLRNSISSLVCAHMDWKPFLAKYGAGVPRYFSDLGKTATDEHQEIVEPHAPQAATSTLQLVHSVASEVIGDLDLDEPLTAAGMDSLSAVELRRKLAQNLGEGTALPSTIAFDYPTVRAIASHLDVEPVGRPVEVVEIPNGCSTAVSVAGKACRIPGNETCTTAEEAWREVFQQQLDAVTEIPLMRFDVNECFDVTASGVGFLTYARHASAIDGVELFDNRFFGISSNEAAAIDPQQRQHLEVAYAACHDAGRPRKDLAKKTIGVFVGQCANDWAKTLSERKAGTFMGPGSHASISANRISFCLGLEGVSVTMDTACSSTLVALDLAMQRLATLEAVLCSGGQLNLIVEPFVSFCNGRLLSPTGRCKTFEAAADGFARGEGFGSFLLVQANMETISVAGAMANQDGRSSSLTAPNGPAQQRAITGALRLAGANGAEITAVECHGTGTALGDPIEVGALGATLQEGREEPLLLLAGKTNVGHLEGAAGALGLLKCIMALTNLEVPPNVHLSELNPHLDLKDFLVVPSSSHVVSESAPKMGLSSFGFGGTNAHAVLARRGPLRPPGDEVNFKSVPFPWAQVPRLLRLYRTGKETVFEVQLDKDLLEYQRQLYKQKQISPALLVALAMEGCRRHVKQAASVQLKALKMTAPCILPSDYDGHTWLRLSINEQQFEVGSRHRFSQKAWQIHCVGRFSTQVATRPSTASLGSLSILGGVRRPLPASAPRAESFEVLCRSCAAQDGALEELKMKAEEEGLLLSDRTFGMLSDVHVGKGEFCARVKIPADFSAYTVHPQLLDVLHLAALCLAHKGDMAKSLAQDLTSMTSLSVPSQEIPKGTEYLVLHSRERRYGINPESISSSSTLSVDGGPLVLEVQEMLLRPVKERQVLSAAATKSTESEVPSLYEMHWSPSSSGRTFQEEGGRWLLLCPGDLELAQGLSQCIEKENLQVDTADSPKDDESDKESDTKLVEDEDIEERSSCVSEASPSALSRDGRSHRASDSAPMVATCRDSLPEDEELGTFLEGFEKIFVIASGSGSPRAVEVMAAALRVMKAQSKVTELWFVVEGTQAAQVEDLSKSSIPYHAGLWGLARCARREQREHFVGCLEVGCSSGRAACAAGIWRRLRIASASQEDGREHELLVRRSMQGAEESGSDEEDVERHVARLEQTTPKAFGVWPPPIFPSHSWFAISGGCGALGLATGAWLVNQGVQHVALLSRSGKCQDGEAAKDLQELYSGNVRVLMQRCDVSSQDAVKSAAEAMKALDGIPVKGVVHAAGLLEDHLIAHMEQGHLQPVLAPKMDGAIHLQAAFGEGLEHFLLFSSVAALLGSPGQGNYAAANSFLDSFATHRQAKGLPALSLQWGPWAEIGMAARSGVGGPGFWAPKICPADALQALGSVLAASSKTSPSVMSITHVNWSVLLKRMPSMPPSWSNFKSHWEAPVVPQEPDREEDRKSRFAVSGGDPSRALRPGIGMVGMGGMPLSLGLNMSFGREMPSREGPKGQKGKDAASSESPCESSDEPPAAKGL